MTFLSSTDEGDIMAVDYKLIGTRIKSYRKAKKLTQEKLAELLNISVGYVSKMERGIEHPNLEMLSNIADICNCDIANLVSESTISQTEYLDDDFRKLLEELYPDQKSMLYYMLKYYLSSGK